VRNLGKFHKKTIFPSLDVIHSKNILQRKCYFVTNKSLEISLNFLVYNMSYQDDEEFKGGDPEEEEELDLGDEVPDPMDDDLFADDEEEVVPAIDDPLAEEDSLL
jgi:hypothetical protein